MRRCSPGPDSPAYEASKGAVSMLTRSLAASYALASASTPSHPERSKTGPSLADLHFPRAMLRLPHPPPVAAPEDVAAVTAFLLGDDAPAT
ncbi:hypothetical protein ABZ806_31100 [Spirillospora sp. NPDC047418]